MSAEGEGGERRGEAEGGERQREVRGRVGGLGSERLSYCKAGTSDGRLICALSACTRDEQRM